MSRAAQIVASKAIRNLTHKQSAHTRFARLVWSTSRMIWTDASPKDQPHVIPAMGRSVVKPGARGSSFDAIKSTRVAMKSTANAYSHCSHAGA